MHHDLLVYFEYNSLGNKDVNMALSTMLSKGNFDITSRQTLGRGQWHKTLRILSGCFACGVNLADVAWLHAQIVGLRSSARD